MRIASSAFTSIELSPGMESNGNSQKYRRCFIAILAQMMSGKFPLPPSLLRLYNLEILLCQNFPEPT